MSEKLTVNDFNNGYLFRYRDFNTNTLKEIIDNELWHSSVRELNDPFESYFKMDDSFLLDKDEVLKAAYVFFGEKAKDKCIHDYFNNYEKLLRSVKKSYKSNSDMLEKVFSKYLICCFSKQYNEPLMWSHYANGLRGLCIVYNKEKLNKTKILKGNMTDVLYDTTPYISKIKDIKTKVVNNEIWIDLDKSDCKKCAFSKHSRWGYEEEVRTIIHFSDLDSRLNTSGYAVTVGYEPIEAIIYGEKMSKTNLKILDMICKNKGIQLFKASAKIKDFSVVVEEV
ncbi:DUF2971 domain-containing protein [Photobacterium phosphoreum]|uniref:DUF2971 domain-containing protein n=1 Tax=Photobacterium phosphoreum TaxID=659 RepID=UPI0039B05A55